MRPTTLFVLLFIVGTTVAGPVSWDHSTCSQQCGSGNSKFNFSEGATYRYSFESLNSIETTGSPERSVSMLKCTLEIITLTKCDRLLQLKDVEVNDGVEHPHTKDSLEDLLTANSLAFSVEDGIIRAICPYPDEDEEALNIKRAILSAFQNSMMSFSDQEDYVTEIDISGECKTKYQLKDEKNGQIIVTKSKYLSTCTKRHGGNSVVFNQIYNPPEDSRQSLPILSDETSKCEQVIQDGVIRVIRCQEGNRFKPFTRQDSHAKSKANVTILLIEVNKNEQLPQYVLEKKSDLLYRQTAEKYSDTASADAVDILRHLCSMSEDVINPEMPSLFSQFVRVLLQVDPSSMEDIYVKLENGTPCSAPWIRDIAKDALPHVGNEGAINVMVKKILGGRVSKLQSAIWLTSLAFVVNPTEEAILAAVPLLLSENGGSQALLGVTAMCHTFCMRRSSCEQTSTVQQVISALSKYLAHRCQVSGVEETDQVISALKAFGNLGQVGNATNAILSCAIQSSNKIPIRIAAIEAFRRVPGNREVRNRMYELYSCPKEPVEIRVPAYLAAMRITDAELIGKVIATLRKEKSNQMRSFVWTHLRNLQKSSSPLKQNLRELLSHVVLPSYIDLDIMKYSQNLDLSYFSQQLNIGGEFDSNIIYSGNSYVPRSFMANLTMFAFGHHLSLLEVGARMEGFEYRVEKLFASLNKKNWFWRTLNAIGGIVNKIPTQERPELWKKREHRFKQKIDLFSERVNAELPNDPKASMYFKYQGNELMWFGFDESADLNLGKAFDLMDILSEMAKNNKIDTVYSLMFLDTSLVCPTITGRGLQLSINGSATVGLRGHGKFDIRKALSHPYNIDINGEFHPSMAAEIDVIMRIKSSTGPGVKFRSKMSASTPVKGNLRVKDGRLVNLRFDMPSQKIALYRMSMDIVRIDESGRELPIGGPPSKTKATCITALRPAIGIDFCTKLEIPRPVISRNSPYIPFNGPFSIEVSILRHDRSLQTYELLIELPEHKVYENKVYKFNFDTPGSAVNRKHQLEICWNNPVEKERLANVTLDTPFKKLDVVGSLVNGDDLKTAKFELAVDKRDYYAIDTELKIHKQGKVMEYFPNITLKVLHHDPVTVSGVIRLKEGRKSQVILEVCSNKPSRKPFSISGNVMKEGDVGRKLWKLSTDIRFTLPVLEWRIFGMAAKQENSFATDVLLDYETERNPHHTLKLASKVQGLSTGADTEIMTMAEMRSSQYPEYNFQLNYDFQHKPREYVENNATLKTGQILKKPLHLLQTTKIIRYSETGKQFKSENKLVIYVPFLAADYDVKLNTDWNFVDFERCKVDAEIKSGQQKYAASLFEYQSTSRSPMNKEVLFELQYPDRNITYKEQIREESPNEYKGRSLFQWQRDKEAIADYTYKIKSDSDIFHHELDATFKAPWLRVPAHQKAIFVMNRNSIDLGSQMEFDGRPRYKVDAKLFSHKESKISIISPQFDGNVKINTNNSRNMLTFDLKRNKSNRVSGHVTLAERPKKLFDIEIKWNADRDPSCNLKLRTELESHALSPSSKQHNLIAKLQYSRTYAAVMNAKVSSEILQGPHDIQVNIINDVNNLIKLHHEVLGGNLTSELTYVKRQEQVFKAVVRGKCHWNNSNIETMGAVSIQSSDSELDEKEVYLAYNQDLSSPLSFVTEVRFLPAPMKLYTLNIDCVKIKDQSTTHLKASIALKIPIHNYKSQEITLSSRYSPEFIVFTSEVVNDRRRQLLILDKIEKFQHGFKVTCDFEVPSVQSMRSGTVHGVFHSEPGKHSFQCQIQANKEMVIDIGGSLSSEDRENFGVAANFSSSVTPSFSGHMSAKKDDYKKDYDVILSKNGKQVFLWKLAMESKTSLYDGSLEIHHLSEKLLKLKLNCESHGRIQDKCTMDAEGSQFDSINITVSCQKQKNRLHSSMAICIQNQSRECIIVEGHYRNDDDKHINSVHREVKINAKSPITNNISFEFQLSKDSYMAKSLLFVKWKDQKVGYEGLAKFEPPKNEVIIQVFLPSRAMKLQSSLSNDNNKTIIKSEFLPNANHEPSNKLVIQISHNDNQERENKYTHTDLSLDHPDLRKPITVSFDLKDQIDRFSHPINIQLEIDYSNTPGSKLFGILRIETTDTEYGNNSLILSVYKEDRQNLDMSVKMLVGRDNELMSCSSSWEFSTSRVKRKSGSLGVELSQNDKTYGIWYNHPGVKFEGKGMWIISKDEGLFSKFAFGYNDRQKEKLQTSIDYKRRCGELAYFTDSDISPRFRYNICINSDNKSLFTIIADSYYGNRKASDFLLAFNSGSNNIFNLNIEWTPDLGKILHYLSTLIEKISEFPWLEVLEEIPHLWSEFITFVSGDLFGPLGSYLKSELSKLAKELKWDTGNLKRLLKELYDKLPTLVDIGKVTQPIIDWFQKLRSNAKMWLEKHVSRHVKGFFISLKTWFQRHFCYRDSICDYIREEFSEHNLVEGAYNIVRRLLKLILDAAAKVSLHTGEFRFVKLIEISRNILDSVRDCYHHTISKVYECLAPIFKTRFMMNIKRHILRTVVWIEGKLEEYKHNIQRNIDQIIKDIQSNVGVKSILDTLNIIIDKLKEEFNELKLKDIWEKLQDEVLSRMSMKGMKSVLIFDSSQGRIRVEIRPPIGTQHLKKTLMDWVTHKESEVYRPSLSVLDVYNKFQTLPKRSWIPPFNADAMLVNNHHFLTFDKNVYDFKGNCSYLLLSDFVDRNFSVILKYHVSNQTGESLKTIIVISRDHNVEITPLEGISVSVNRKLVDLPLKLDHLTVIRTGQSIEINDDYGLTINCHLIYNACTTTVNGWYFGKLAGLFGTYDNEENNDLMLPEGDIATNSSVFSDGWEVSGRCHSKSKPLQISIDPRSIGYFLCQQYFRNDESPLRPCFTQIPPEKYFQLCVRATATPESRFSPNKVLCSVAAGYANLCKRQGYKVTLPPICLDCKIEKEHIIQYGVRREVQVSESLADIIFIVEESMCNVAFIKNLNSLARKIDRELRDSGYRNVHFGVIGYKGADQQKPLSHTAHGKLLFGVKDLMLSVRTLRLDNRLPEQLDIFTAILVATSYPFHVGANKIFILAACQHCVEGAMSVSYPDLRHALLEQNIVLHVTSDVDIITGGSPSKSRGIFGIDSETVYTTKDITQKLLKGLPELRNQVWIPKDICYTLAFETSGSFFTTKPISQGLSSDGKNWETVFSRRIARVRHSSCQICECVETETFDSKTYCRPCERDDYQR